MVSSVSGSLYANPELETRNPKLKTHNGSQVPIPRSTAR